MNTTTAAEGYKDFDDVVKEVRDNDPGISDRVLEPDGYFQTRRTNLNEISRAVIELNRPILSKRNSTNLPTVVFAWGKCRVGSTALTNLFGMAGVPAYYNPVKTAVRHFVVESQGQGWDIPPRSENLFVFAKEMSGPYFLADCIINPLQILVESGYPTDRIELLLLDRDPYRSLASWLNKWSHIMPEERLVQHYVLSALNGIRIRAYGEKLGIRVSHYVYEASRIPDVTVQRMFERLGVGRLYHGNVVDNWNERGALASERSKIIFPPAPKQHTTPGLHASEPHYRYKERSADRVSPRYRALIENTGVLQHYLQAALACAQELRLTQFERAKVFDGTPVAGTPPDGGLDRRWLQAQGIRHTDLLPKTPKR